MFKLDEARVAMADRKKSVIARKIGKSYNSLHRYITGAISPDKSTAIALALTLNLPPMSLWDEEAELKSQKPQRSA
jgi:hypothetical protein